MLAYLGKQLGERRISTILAEEGLSRKKLKYYASGKYSPTNVQYAADFSRHVRRFNKVAFFDESGISKTGMENRRAVGWATRGGGGSVLERVLRDWPSENLTVMAFLDRDGVFGLDVHTGGTTRAYVDSYFANMARILHARGIDAIILDNATSHNPARINYYMARYGIAVAFLPRYWPEWNPIELAWNWLKDGLVGQMRALKRNPVPVIRRVLGTIGAPLARAFIRHADVYPARWSA